MNISHSRDADMGVFLISATGTRVELFTDVGGNGNNSQDTIIDNEAATMITNGFRPLWRHSYRPEGSLSALYGESLLEASDDRNGQSGTLNS